MSANGLVSSIRRLMQDEERRRSTNSASPFEHLRQQMEDIIGDGGIMKQVVQPGDGPPVPESASVIMHYSGFLEYSEQPFETTLHKKYPQIMKLGRDVTLGGLELGLLTMKKGEFSRLLLQPQYAYGDMGCPPMIPAHALVLYEVHVLDFLDSGQVDEFLTLCHEEQNASPLSTFLDVVNTLRGFGNRCFNQSRFYNAKDRYKQALTLLESRSLENVPEKETLQTALLPLYLNLSLTELRLQSPKKALKYGNKALQIDGDNTKALFRCGQAYLELQDFERAQQCLLLAQGRKPFDSDINNLLRKVATLYKENLDEQKDMCSKMFKQFSSTEI
ncbi:inactive peptidyl-prolyl cis-trans isomerase FKBP6 [Eucyclogobius newberryi]|uniref:inactive peptidyl-prolyl cis-trans isomerase FKBP6 n=1 Tax=Eucyclogobius newberryi TaxID=166745 RepID=UPI003B593F48